MAHMSRLVSESAQAHAYALMHHTVVMDVGVTDHMVEQQQACEDFLDEDPAGLVLATIQ